MLYNMLIKKIKKVVNQEKSRVFYFLLIFTQRCTVQSACDIETPRERRFRSQISRYFVSCEEHRGLIQDRLQEKQQQSSQTLRLTTKCI